ncbi:unnamed protein product, partial [Ectocarpus sp. 13 AM-2016]
KKKFIHLRWEGNQITAALPLRGWTNVYRFSSPPPFAHTFSSLSSHIRLTEGHARLTNPQPTPLTSHNPPVPYLSSARTNLCVYRASCIQSSNHAHVKFERQSVPVASTS